MKPRTHAASARRRASILGVVRLACREPLMILFASLAALILINALPLSPTTSARQTNPRASQQNTSPNTSRDSVAPSEGEPLEGLDVPALIAEVVRRAKAADKQRYDYTWTTKHTEREVDNRGALKKEIVEVYETYPVRGETVKKLVSRNGVPVAPERAAKELKRAIEQLEEAERKERKKAEAKPSAAVASPPITSSSPTSAPSPSSTVAAQDPNAFPSFGPSSGFSEMRGLKTREILISLWQFLRAGEFQAPRRVVRLGRAAILLDFRPRADFRPAGQVEMVYARLAGRVWIDEEEKAVVRLEAWPLKPTAQNTAAAPPAVVLEQTRLPDGMWMESFVRIRTTADVQTFNGVSVDYTKEVSDFRRFDVTAGDSWIESPKPRP